MTSDEIQLIYENIKNNLLKCQVLVNGSYKDVEIQKTEISGTSIKVYAYLDETIVGTITRYRLVMTNGKIFDERNDSVTKDDTRGLLTVFEYKIREE